VKIGQTTIASFVYDGDGNRVQSIIGGTTTTFVGNYYEVSGDNITQYYYAGTQRVAMRKDGTLTFMLSDQLGSTSVTTDSSGQNPTTLEYDPWGGTRFASKDGNGNDNTPTNYRYTGQRQEPSFGLYFYQARWYDPGISQFASPDTMIPNTYNPLDWNRYSYTDDNPVNRTDPTGHRNCEEDDYDCYAEPTTPTTTATATPRPPCSICSTNQYAQSLYNAVRSHQSQLPPGFPPALLLAMAAVESGGNTPPYQNSTTQGGALQLRGSNASESTYPDTQTGYDQNVSDAIKFINTEYSNAAATTGELTHFHYLYTNIYPNNADEVTAARTVLYYNGGMGWMDKSPDNPYSYWNSPGNKPYVGNVAGMLTSYVPKQFGLDAGPTLINILISVQADVNASVP
jgi:RHS repeat-associated protein